MILISKYRQSSVISGNILAARLGIRTFSPRTPPNPRHIGSRMINWGLSTIPWYRSTLNMLNRPDRVKVAANKLHTFDVLRDARLTIPNFTACREVADNWFNIDNRSIVFCRTKLTGSCGEGIVVARSRDQMVSAPLYVKYIKKAKELRVHVVDGRVIHLQQKRRLTSEQLNERGINEREPLIRNLGNGYIFSTNIDRIEGSVMDEVHQQSISSVFALGLNFGAVDVIITPFNSVFILEVNTAPGLEGVTLEKYEEAFRLLM